MALTELEYVPLHISLKHSSEELFDQAEWSNPDFEWDVIKQLANKIARLYEINPNLFNKGLIPFLKQLESHIGNPGRYTTKPIKDVAITDLQTLADSLVGLLVTEISQERLVDGKIDLTGQLSYAQSVAIRFVQASMQRMPGLFYPGTFNLIHNIE